LTLLRVQVGAASGRIGLAVSNSEPELQAVELRAFLVTPR